MAYIVVVNWSKILPATQAQQAAVHFVVDVASSHVMAILSLLFCTM